MSLRWFLTLERWLEKQKIIAFWHWGFLAGSRGGPVGLSRFLQQPNLAMSRRMDFRCIFLDMLMLRLTWSERVWCKKAPSTSKLQRLQPYEFGIPPFDKCETTINPLVDHWGKNQVYHQIQDPKSASKRIYSRQGGRQHVRSCFGRCARDGAAGLL